MGVRATIEIHHAVTVYSSKFPALLGTTMVDYTDTTSVTPGFASLHWHPNMTGPQTTVVPVSENT